MCGLTLAVRSGVFRGGGGGLGGGFGGVGGLLWGGVLGTLKGSRRETQAFSRKTLKKTSKTHMNNLQAFDVWVLFFFSGFRTWIFTAREPSKQVNRWFPASQLFKTGLFEKPPMVVRICWVFLGPSRAREAFLSSLPARSLRPGSSQPGCAGCPSTAGTGSSS